MHRDGSFEPLTFLAEVLGLTLLGAATGCFLVARHRFRALDAAASAELHRRLTEHMNITGPSPYRP